MSQQTKLTFHNHLHQLTSGLDFFKESLCFLFFLASLLPGDVGNIAYQTPQVFGSPPFTVFKSETRIKVHWKHNYKRCDIWWWSHCFSIHFQKQQQHPRQVLSFNFFPTSTSWQQTCQIGRLLTVSTSVPFNLKLFFSNSESKTITLALSILTARN